MERVWKRIEKWLAANAPNLLRGFNPPASAHEIAKTEKSLGVEFPDDVRMSYLRHNGHSGLFDDQCWFSLAGMRAEWASWNEMRPVDQTKLNTPPEEGSFTRKGMWNPRWIPLIDLEDGNQLYLDFAPGPKGKVGQVIMSWVDCDTHPVEAASFKEWLAREADQLEAGEYVESYGTLLPRCTIRVIVERRASRKELVGWSFVHDLAVEFGWKPTEDFREPCGQKIATVEAAELAQALCRAHKEIPMSKAYRPPKRASKAKAFFLRPSSSTTVGVGRIL